MEQIEQTTHSVFKRLLNEDIEASGTNSDAAS